MAFITMMQQRQFAFSAAEFHMHQENNSTWTLTLNESVPKKTKSNRQTERLF
jgi:hypothetical protein